MQWRLSLLLLAQLAATGCACKQAANYQPYPVPPVGTRAPAGLGLSSPGFEDSNRFSSGSERSLEMAGLGAAQATPAYRSPQTAFCLACLIAGGGHFYTGETVKGAALLGITAGSLVVGSALSSDGGDGQNQCEYSPETHECEPGRGRTPLLVGAAIAAGSWVYGIIDSRASAQRMNARNGPQGGAELEARPWLNVRGGNPSAGLSFRVSW
ncbi:MAG: hypothetical protein ACRERX_21290 [Pseudomonas sp.]